MSLSHYVGTAAYFLPFLALSSVLILSLYLAMNTIVAGQARHDQYLHLQKLCNGGVVKVDARRSEARCDDGRRVAWVNED